VKVSRDAVIVFVIFALFGVVSYFMLGGAPAQEAEKTTHFTSFSSTKSGVKALFVLLDKLGYDTQQLREPPDSTAPDADVLVVVKPTVRYPSVGKSSSLGRWVRGGGTLLVFIGAGDVVPGLDLSAVGSGAGSGNVEAWVSKEYSAGVRRLQLHSTSRFANTYGGVLASDKLGAISVERRIGKGAVIALSDPWLASNSEIGKADNAVFLANLISEHVDRGGRVAFDEYSQGFEAPKTPLGVLPPAVRLALGQTVLVALLALYSAGRRFGAVRPAQEAHQRRPAHEYVRAVGRLYRKAHAGGPALGLICDSFRLDVCRRLGIAGDSDIDAIAEAAGLITDVDGALLADTLRKCDSASSGDCSESQMLDLARAIGVLRKEIGIDR
jgi:hypothetical protein